MGEQHDHSAGRCREVIESLYAYLDGECVEAHAVTVRAHLEECSPCLEAFDFEAELRVVIATRCSEQLPPGFKERMLEALRQVQQPAEG